MGIVREQSIKNSISFYFGMAIGAINTVIVYPNVFNENPEHFGLIQILVAYAVVVSTFTTLGIPKTFIRFFPIVKDKGQLYVIYFNESERMCGQPVSRILYWIISNGDYSSRLTVTS